jgi:hypothetical protein
MPCQAMVDVRVTGFSSFSEDHDNEQFIVKLCGALCFVSRELDGRGLYLDLSLPERVRTDTVLTVCCEGYLYVASLGALTEITLKMAVFFHLTSRTLVDRLAYVIFDVLILNFLQSLITIWLTSEYATLLSRGLEP